jgi:sodium-dependent phosphate cotransporter
MAGDPQSGKRSESDQGTHHTEKPVKNPTLDERENPLKTWGMVILLFGILYLFLVSIGMMGGSFKLFGKSFAEQLVTTTSNPIVGLFVGILATTLVQSSSTTTSLIVGIVAAGSLTIENAVPIVMGANVGTTVTNTLVSMGHITRRTEFRRALAGATVHDFFNLIAVSILLPLELAFGYLKHFAELVAGLFVGVGGMKLANPIKAIVKPTVELSIDLMHENAILILIASLVLMYLSLKFLVNLARGLVVKRAERFLHQYMFGSVGLAMIFGMILTVLVQSSSITTSLVIPLLGAGILTIQQIFPYTLGANVGTTITSMLAALSTANIAAITIAFVHLLFNLSGIALIYPIPAIRNIPIRMAEFLASFTSRYRGLAIVYMVGVFYVVPVLVIFLWR